MLIATTIVESGIDNACANTLIIEDSQRLGLAQLYQLKGRVGRSATQAYAYFMFPGELPLTEEATARLTALSEFQDLGSGMRIAMRDLEIRGAGSLMAPSSTATCRAWALTCLRRCWARPWPRRAAMTMRRGGGERGY